MSDRVFIKMKYGRDLSFGPLMTDRQAADIVNTNDNVSRKMMGAPNSGGGGRGAVPPRGGIVPGIAGGARPGRQTKASDSGLPRAANPATQFIMSAVYMAVMAGILKDAFGQALAGGSHIAVTPDTPGIPANLLPQGLEFYLGPCTRWDQIGVGNGYTPIPTSDGMYTPCTRTSVSEAASLTRLTDSQVDTELSSGRMIMLNAPQNTWSTANNTYRYWANYAWVHNPLGIQNPGWNSAIHGKPWPIPGKPGYAYDRSGDPFSDLWNSLLDRLGYKRFELQRNATAYRSGNTIVVPTTDFWGQSNNNIRTDVNQGIQKPPPAKPPKPPTIYDPWQPHDPNVKTVHRYTPQMRRVSRVVGKAGRGVRESKGNIAKAVSHALDVMGSLSEIGDDIDSIYKSLPASIRKRALAENGKALNWKQKLDVLYNNANSIKIDKAVAGMITSRVDDYIASKINEPFDKALQVAVPDYLTRLGVRQAIRWAYWKSGAESPIPQAPSSQRFLPEQYRQEELVTKRHQNY